MNLWWALFIPLACLWVLPMMRAHQAHMPWMCFVGVGALWTVLFLFIRPLYDWDTGFLRKVGLIGMADFRERMKPSVLAPVRAALLIVAALSFLFAAL